MKRAFEAPRGVSLPEHRNRMRLHRVAVRVCAAAIALSVLFAVPSPLASAALPRPPTFAEDVAPLLARWCVGCHGGAEPEARLRLDSWASLLAGGKSGPPVIIFDPAASLIMAKVERRERAPMPPRKRLPRAAVVTLRAWIAAGAPP